MCRATMRAGVLLHALLAIRLKLLFADARVVVSGMHGGALVVKMVPAGLHTLLTLHVFACLHEH